MDAGEREMPAKEKDNVPSVTGFIVFVAAAALAALADVSALVLVSTELRATDAAYAVYAAAVALTVCAGAVLLRYRREFKAFLTDRLHSTKIVAALRRHRLFGRILSDYGARTLFSSIVVLAANIVYVVYLALMAMIYESAWYGALAGFYAWLVVIRSAVVLWERYFARESGAETAPMRRKRLIAVVSGCALIVAGGVASAPIIQMSIGSYPQGGGIPDVVINAVFAFVKMTSAIVQVVRAAGYRDPVAQSLRNVSLVTAMMSLLTLQVSIIIAFAHGYSMWEYVVGLGVLVSTATIVSGVYMTARHGYALTHGEAPVQDADVVGGGTDGAECAEDAGFGEGAALAAAHAEHSAAPADGSAELAEMPAGESASADGSAAQPGRADGEPSAEESAEGGGTT